eukprot:gene2538-2907_t
MYEVEAEVEEVKKHQGVVPKTPSEYMKVQRQFRQQTKHPKTGRDIPKAKRPPVDYSSVLDFHNLDNNTQSNRALIIDHTDLVDKTNAPTSPFYAHPSTWRVYGLVGYPGFYFIVSPFSSSQQKKWIADALEHYASPPNDTNLNLFYGPVPNLWQQGQTELISYHNNLRESLTNTANTSTTQQSTQQQQQQPLDKHGQPLPSYRTLLDKLAWASLGYQFQWTPRIYSEEFYEEFPHANATKYNPYVAEAATINYYSEDSIMGGHLDDAEEEMEKPIVSISFGSTAVFLMGAETKDVSPIPLYIRSGDIVIMGGRSRYCYHGVAKIVEDSFSLDLVDENDEQHKWQIHWMKEKNRRININTRQVFKVPKRGTKSTTNSTSTEKEE